MLLAYGVAFAAQAFGRGVPAFDDHPGQFFRLWHALERSLPGGAWTADWNPDWWAGYPELQFYPPGFVLAGLFIRLVALWAIPVETVYQLLGAVVLLLPAVTTYLLLARIHGDPWLALAPAFLALTLSGGLRTGIEESLRWGTMTGRLAFGLLPLLLLALRPWVEGGSPARWAPLVGAAVILAHPVAVPPALVVLATAGLIALARQPRRRVVRTALVLLGLMHLLAAFWLLPLLARRAWMTPLAWGTFSAADLAAEILARPIFVALVLGTIAGLASAIRRGRAFEILVGVLPVPLAGLLGLDALLFAAGWSPIEPARVVDALLLGCLWTSGLALGALGLRLAPRGGGLLGPVLPAAAIALAALTAGAGATGRTGEATLTLWPDSARWPTLEEVAGDHDLPGLWAALRDRPDRVLFLTSALRLDADPAWYAPHSHVLSLAPLFAGREIVNGTFTHPAPLAARFYAGSASRPPRIETLVERLDRQTLLGEQWPALGADRFEAFARRLRIATVVVPASAGASLDFLRPAYEPTDQRAGFAIFERRDRPWARVERITHRRYRVLASAAGGVWIPTGIAAYPLWHAKSANGALPTRADEWGLLEVQLPVDVFEAELVYDEGWLEWIALGLSLAAVVAWLRSSRGVRPRLGQSPSGPAARVAASRYGSGRSTVSKRT
jgi:hypothetical protein